MRILDTIKAINQLQSDGILEKYALGGAVGAGFYIEAAATLDVDIFIPVHIESGSSLVDLMPFYRRLRERGYPMEGEYFIIEDTHVQFLPPISKLVEEAIEQAVHKKIGDTSVRVFSLEHLAAIALETGRHKDKNRLLQFREVANFDIQQFESMVERHGLAERWKKFQEQFPIEPT